ncbi:hypothetical protein ACSCB1_38745 [Streptomyces europaeiscabiei]|uniref:hypothetical protein n=1 Tax=Streptomyces TaxID=1883 RepID=UPI000A8D031C|nr:MULTISPECIES: hypothetical protein [Streptomyces]
MRDFAAQLPMQVLFEMFGSPPDIGRRIVQALVKLFDTAQDAVQANAELWGPPAWNWRTSSAVSPGRTSPPGCWPTRPG